MSSGDWNRGGDGMRNRQNAGSNVLYTTIVYGVIFHVYEDHFEVAHADKVGDGICIYEPGLSSPWRGDYADVDTWTIGESFYYIKADVSTQASYDDRIYPADYYSEDWIPCDNDEDDEWGYFICMDCEFDLHGLSEEFSFPTSKGMVIWGDGITTSSTVGGNDIIAGWDNFDALYGGHGYDVIHGEGDNDWIAGNHGTDTLYQDGCDSSKVYPYIPWIVGNEGTDEIHGSSCNDALQGGDGNDEIFGYWGDDTIEGNADTDMLYGGWGDDTLVGGGTEAEDNCYGYYGTDTCSLCDVYSSC